MSRTSDAKRLLRIALDNGASIRDAVVVATYGCPDENPALAKIADLDELKFFGAGRTFDKSRRVVRSPN